MRGLGSALELLRTSRRGHQRRATRVSLARIVQQRRAHEPAHGPLESGARHSRDLRGGPRDRGYLRCESLPTVEPSRMLSSDMIQRVCEGSTTRGAASTHHERADAPRPFEATWRARKSTTSATGIAVSAALCVRLATLSTLRGPPRRYRPRDTRQARVCGPSPAAAHAQRR